ncbi:MAG: hypothetical protein E6J91_24175 [Deltaproteobacteria bacterium]|nr:MAG: hypothetical protein E6J91_24175 [Deltaproteobacteria bacterium]
MAAIRPIAVSIVLAALATTAAAEPAPPRAEAAELLTSATVAFAALRYDEALGLADQAWRSGGSDPEQVRRIFALAGRAAGSIGDDEAARLWFRRWLYLDPAATLPEGTSPKLTALLGDARDALAGAAIAARITARPGEIAVTVADDPLDLVAAVRAGATSVALRDHAAALPASTAARRIELVDRHGNTLAAIAVVGVAVATTAPSLPPWSARPSTWMIASGALAAVGGGALWLALDARSSLRDLDRDSTHHEYTEARAIEQRFDRAQLVAGVAIGGAALAAIAGTVLWLRGGGEPSLRASAGGASLTWSVAF